MSRPNLDGADSPAIGISVNSWLTPGTPYMSAAARSAVPARNATRQRRAATPRDTAARIQDTLPGYVCCSQ